MKVRFVLLFTLLAASLSAVDLTSYSKPNPPNFQFRLYRQVLPQTMPTSLSAVVTQLVGCATAQGGTTAVTTYACGVYIDALTISCPTGSAGTILVQDQQSTPIPIVPTITNAANTLYTLTFPWVWAPGGFKVQQVTGTGCVFSASWGVV